MYNQYFTPYINTAVSCILKYLPITSEDNIVDIGGGTGEVAQRVLKQAQLKNPILCVDPSEGMLEIAKGRDGIETFHATAEEFFASSEIASKLFTKVMICGCAHLFVDREAVFRSLKNRLPTNGACIVIYWVNASHLIPAGAEKFNAGYVQKEVEIDCKIFDEVGLKWRVLDEVATHPIKKNDWYTVQRMRMLRCVEGLSDVEIEEGIKVLEEKYGSQEMFDLNVHFKVAILTCS